MSSGPTRIIYNTRERLVSTDHNREQAFVAQAHQAAWRAQYNDLRANWRLTPGLSAQAQVVGAPLYGEVYSGLFVRPDAPSYLTIDPGLAMVIATSTPSADDSPYVFVNDPGLQTPGVLTFTPNAAAATLRWDVVECQPVDTLLESSSRDIYNPATGLFVPGVVDKVRASRMTYRIRLGTPGAGFPGAAAGWLPLAVAAVRDGATGFDRCDFYDVRPLVSERVLPQPVNVDGTEGFALPRETHYSAADGLFSGYAEAEFGGYLAGGKLQTSVPATDLASFGVTTAGGGDNTRLRIDNASNVGVYTLASNSPIFAAALFPQPPIGQGFVPRWARYSEAPVAALGRRVPNGPRGILALTSTPPNANGLYSPVAFPAAAQLNVLGVGVSLGITSGFAGPVLGASVQVGRRYEHSSPAGFGYLAAANSVSADLAVWNLVPGVHFPAHARAIIVTFALNVTTTGTTKWFQLWSTVAGAPFTVTEFPSGLDDGAVTAATPGQSVITIPRFVTGTGYPSTPNIDWSFRLKPSAAGCTFNVANMFIRGWEF